MSDRAAKAARSVAGSASDDGGAELVLVLVIWRDDNEDNVADESAAAPSVPRRC